MAYRRLRGNRADAKMADLVMLATEGRDITNFVQYMVDLPDPLPDIIKPWSWEEAEHRFLYRAKVLLNL